MTIPFFIENPTENHRPQVRVPYDIVQYCDDHVTVKDRTDLRYIDCVWMNMGYYGTPPHIMKAVRDEHFNRSSIHPIFE